MPSAEQTNFLENSGWSSRSRSVFLMWFFIPWGDATVFTLGFLSAVFYCRNLIDLVSDHDIFPVRYVVSCWPILSIRCTRSMTTARIRVSSRWYCCDHLHCYLQSYPFYRFLFVLSLMFEISSFTFRSFGLQKFHPLFCLQGGCQVPSTLV